MQGICALTSPSILDNFRDIIQSISADGNHTRALINIVNIGKQLEPIVESNIISKLTRVPGCLSVVEIYPEIVRSNERDSAVIIHGRADSMLSKGMISIISQVLNGLSPDDILKINMKELLFSQDLLSLFPSKRLIGLGSILDHVQSRLSNEFSSDFNLEPSRVNIEDPRADEVAVLLSGGVDSSTALQILVNQVICSCQLETP